MSTEALSPYTRAWGTGGPTGTFTHSKQFAQRLRGVLSRINARIREAIIERDLFNLQTESLETRYEESDEVDTPDGQGVVVDAITKSFESPEGEEIEASDDSPAYAVLLADEDKQVGFYKASDLEETTIEADVENPESDLEAMMDMAVASAEDYESLQEGFFEWPESWQESPQPARLIALKAWAGMGGSFDGCEREMRGEIAAPQRFCADFLDRLVGNPYWRGDSWAPGD